VGQALALDDLLLGRQIWRGKPSVRVASAQPTGHAALDAALPMGGWPERALTEILLSADGVGELALLLPTLCRLTQARQDVVLIAPPYIPYAPAWQVRGVDLSYVHIIDTPPERALWAFEQCLRSGACAAVLGWPQKVDHHALRRLQVAADAGHALGFALRDSRHVDNASPAALRLEMGAQREVRVRKCRGGPVPMQAFPMAIGH